MKRYYDYADDELLGLAEEDVRRLIDIECAHEGVGLLPGPPPTAPLPVPTGPTVEAFQLSGNFLFPDRQTAEAAQEFLGSLPRVETYYVKGAYSYGHNDNPQGIRPESDNNDLSISRQMYWDPKVYAEHKTELQAFAEAKSKFTEENREYEKLAEKRERIGRNVKEAIDNARSARRDREMILSTFDQYQVLAEGNRDIALGFLLKTLEDRGWDEKVVREVVGMPLPELDDVPVNEGN